jgi:integrase
VLNAAATGRGGGSGMTTATIGKRITAIAERAKAAGILRSNLHVSPHTMRHTCATRLVGAGIPIDQVQRHLGHASMSTTAIYLHSAADLAPVFSAMAGEAAA